MTAVPEDTGATRVGYEPSGAPGDPVEHLQPGTLLVGGRYRIVDKIGDGAMSTVYAAVDTMASAQVALKILTGRYRTRPDAEQRLLNEAEYAGRLPDHPNLVRPLAVGRVPELLDRPYLAMELAHGPLLAMTIIFETPMSLERVCSLVGGVARAVADLHRFGIVHRDIKPTNVMVVDTPAGQVTKLIDFGLATIVGEGRTSAHELTQDHERPGTKRYMAPEQAAGVKPTPAFDVYALGVTLHEALTGVTPWHDHPEEEVVRRKADPDQPAFSLGGARMDVPPLLRDVVDRCLAREPEQRPTAQQVSLVLDSVLSELQGRPVTTVAARMAGDAARVVDRTEVATPRGPRTDPRGIKIVGEGAVVEEIVVTSSGPDVVPVVPRKVSEQVMTAPTGRHPNIPTEAPARSSAVWVVVAVVLLLGAGAIGWKVFGSSDGEVARGEGSPPSSAAAGPVDGGAPEPSAKPETKLAPVEPVEPVEPSPPSDSKAVAVVPMPSDTKVEAPDTKAAEPTPPDAGSPSGPKAPGPKAPGTKVPAASPWTTDACVQARKRAESAMASGDYTAVLAAVADKRCWQDKAAHRRLRVTALANTRRFSQCVTAGQGSTDPEVVAYVDLCKSKESSQ